MATRRLTQRTNVSLDVVRARASEFPRLGELVREQTERLADTPMHRDTAPRILALLGETGRNTHAFLGELERTIELFDGEDVPGWATVRRELVRANDRAKFLATAAELVIARWFHEHQMVVSEFEPRTTNGHRADLHVTHRGEELFIEVTSPGPQADDVGTLNTQLHIGLERVESGLAIEVEGFNVDASQPETLKVTRKKVDAVVRDFRRNAARVDTAHLPAAVVTPRAGQPVSIAAVDYDPAESSYTHVTIASSETGFVPNVARLVDRIRGERHQLPEGTPGAVLVDLSRWSDFRSAGYYLAQAAEELTKHQMPTFVGSFLWDGSVFAPHACSSLSAQAAWLDTNLGSKFYDAWL